MPVSILFRHLLSSVLLKTGFFKYRLRQKAGAGQRQILMYHRIVNPSDASGFVEPGMYVTPSTFAFHLETLRQWFTLVSLNDLLNSTSGNEKPLCTVTFDDGWIDFFTNAYPLLQKYQIPATVFPVTSFIGTNKRFWTDELADALLSEHSTTVNESFHTQHSHAVRLLCSFQGTRFQKMEKAINYLKQYSPEKIKEIIEELHRGNNIKNQNIIRSFITWEQMREMSASGLITFGSHTDLHTILTTVSANEVRHELEVSGNKLLEAGFAEKETLSFCYPNGNYSPGITVMVRACGYNNAITTRKGWVSNESDRFALPRTGIHQDISSTKALFLNSIIGFF